MLRSFPKEVWITIGNQSDTFTKIRVASTCKWLRELYGYYQLDRWSKMTLRKRLSHASGIRDQDVIEHLVTRVKTYDEAVISAVKSGHYDMFIYFITKRLQSEYITISKALKYAARYNHRRIFDHIVNTLSQEIFFSLAWGLLGAAQGGHEELVNYFLPLEIGMGFDHFSIGLRGAARGGHRKLVDLFISKGATNWRTAILAAARGGHVELIDLFLLSMSAGYESYNDICPLVPAACTGDSNLVDRALTMRGLTSWHYNTALKKAAKHGHKDIIDLLISKGANHWNQGLNGASQGGHRDLVDFFLSKGANNINLAILKATDYGHRDLKIYLYTKKPLNKTQRRKQRNKQKRFA